MEQAGTSSRLVVKRCLLQILAGTLTVMTENFRGFPQSCHERATTVLQLCHPYFLCILSHSLFNDHPTIQNYIGSAPDSIVKLCTNK